MIQEIWVPYLQLSVALSGKLDKSVTLAKGTGQDDFLGFMGLCAGRVCVCVCALLCVVSVLCVCVCKCVVLRQIFFNLPKRACPN